MKKMLKGFWNFKMMRHRQHRRFMHRLAMTALPTQPLARTRAMIIMGILAFGSELLRRRHARLNQIPELAESGGRV